MRPQPTRVSIDFAAQRRSSPPRERLDDESRDERLLAARLREGVDDFDDRLGAEERTLGAERAGAEALPPDRLRLGAVSRPEDDPREKSWVRDGCEEERSRPEVERTVRSRGIAAEDREPRSWIAREEAARLDRLADRSAPRELP